VNAINLIEVDFYGCAAVEAEWKTYKNHLNDNSKPEDEAWRRTKEKLLSKILFEIAKVLKFDIPAIEIFEGGYAPGGWAHRDMRYNHLPLWTRGVTPPAAPAKEPSISPELLKAND
jgi:hypothetical protein